MVYRRIRTSHPPVLFQLQLNAALARLSEGGADRLVARRLTLRMRDYVESLLMAQRMPPKTALLAMLLEKFTQLVSLSETGKPFVYRKSQTLSLLFDVCAIQSEMRLDAPDELVLAYTRMMMGFLLFNPQPQRIAMIGLGGGSLPKYCYHSLPQAAIAVAVSAGNIASSKGSARVVPTPRRKVLRCRAIFLMIIGTSSSGMACF